MPTITLLVVFVSNVKYCINNNIKSKAPHSITELSLLIYTVSRHAIMRSKALVIHLAKHKFNVDKPNLDIIMFH